MGQSY